MIVTSLDIVLWGGPKLNMGVLVKIQKPSPKLKIFHLWRIVCDTEKVATKPSIEFEWWGNESTDSIILIGYSSINTGNRAMI